MARDFKIKGDTLEEKFKFLDTVLPRLYRKANPNISIVRNPCVISGYFAEGNGQMFRATLFKGMIKKMCLSVGNVVKGEKAGSVDVKLSVLRANGTEENFNIRGNKSLNIIDTDVLVDDGDTFVVSSNGKDNYYYDVSVSILFVTSGKYKNVELVADLSEEDE